MAQHSNTVDELRKVLIEEQKLIEQVERVLKQVEQQAKVIKNQKSKEIHVRRMPDTIVQVKRK